MGDDIELRCVEIVNGGILQIDLFNVTKGEGYRCFADPQRFFKFLGESLKANNAEWLKLQ